MRLGRCYIADILSENAYSGVLLGHVKCAEARIISFSNKALSSSVLVKIHRGLEVSNLGAGNVKHCQEAFDKLCGFIKVFGIDAGPCRKQLLDVFTWPGLFLYSSFHR